MKASISQDRLWYVCRTNIRAEDKAEANLRAAGYETYLPKMRKDIIHHRSKAIITREFVLFNRYLFVGLPAAEQHFGFVHACEGVEGLLGVQGTPMPVPAAHIERFRNAEIDMQFDDTHAAKVHRGEIERTQKEQIRKTFRAGSSKRVVNGPFGGFCALVTNVTGRDTIKAMVSIFGGMVPVEFQPKDLAAE